LIQLLTQIDPNAFAMPPPMKPVPRKVAAGYEACVVADSGDRDVGRDPLVRREADARDHRGGAGRTVASPEGDQQ
jgi:hypothetical protein